MLLTDDEIQSVAVYKNNAKALSCAKKEWGVTPIYRGFFGEGSFGEVYEVVKGKKRYAVKITPFETDAYNYKQLITLKDKLPNFIASVLPTVYNQLVIENELGKQYITLMEFLQHPGSLIKSFDKFPYKGDYGCIKYQLEDPRAMKLQFSLRWLTRNYYIYQWEDVHSDNVLLRPSTGDLVVADVGHFDFLKS